jgi:hypothetical protein
MKRRKLELVSLEEKKEGQVLQDISLTPEQRFVRMFELIEIGFAFSPRPKVDSDRPGMTVFVLKKIKMNKYLVESLEVLTSLEKAQVQYLIIGGVAVNIHGFQRSTGDLDIWYNPTTENFNRLLAS